MPLYEVTSLAPAKIAGKRHDGTGSVISLTESQAKHELVIGSIKAFDPAPPQAEETKAKGRG